MKRLIGLLCVMLLLVVTVFGQDVAPEAKKSILSRIEWNTVLNIIMGLIGLFGGSAALFWGKLKIKIRKAGELLVKFADAVEDDKVDANDKTGLASDARKLVDKI